MKNNFNIDRYLSEAEEKFSGFDGDYDDYDMEDEEYEMSQKKWIACLFQIIMTLITYQSLEMYRNN